MPTNKNRLGSVATVYTRGVAAPAVNGQTLANGPSDAVYVGVGGDINVRMSADNTLLLYKNVPSGTLLPISINALLFTSTTATHVFALYK